MPAYFCVKLVLVNPELMWKGDRYIHFTVQKTLSIIYARAASAFFQDLSMQKAWEVSEHAQSALNYDFCYLILL